MQLGKRPSAFKQQTTNGTEYTNTWDPSKMMNKIRHPSIEQKEPKKRSAPNLQRIFHVFEEESGNVSSQAVHEEDATFVSLPPTICELPNVFDPAYYNELPLIDGSDGESDNFQAPQRTQDSQDSLESPSTITPYNQLKILPIIDTPLIAEENALPSIEPNPFHAMDETNKEKTKLLNNPFSTLQTFNNDCEKNDDDLIEELNSPPWRNLTLSTHIAVPVNNEKNTHQHKSNKFTHQIKTPVKQNENVFDASKIRKKSENKGKHIVQYNGPSAIFRPSLLPVTQHINDTQSVNDLQTTNIQDLDKAIKSALKNRLAIDDQRRKDRAIKTLVGDLADESDEEPERGVREKFSGGRALKGQFAAYSTKMFNHAIMQMHSSKKRNEDGDMSSEIGGELRSPFIYLNGCASPDDIPSTTGKSGIQSAIKPFMTINPVFSPQVIETVHRGGMLSSTRLFSVIPKSKPKITGGEGGELIVLRENEVDIQNIEKDRPPMEFDFKISDLKFVRKGVGEIIEQMELRKDEYITIEDVYNAFHGPHVLQQESACTATIEEDGIIRELIVQVIMGPGIPNIHSGNENRRLLFGVPAYIAGLFYLSKSKDWAIHAINALDYEDMGMIFVHHMYLEEL